MKVEFAFEKIFDEGEIARVYRIQEPQNGFAYLMVSVWVQPANRLPRIASCAMAWLGRTNPIREFGKTIFDREGIFTHEEVLAELGYEVAA